MHAGVLQETRTKIEGQVSLPPDLTRSQAGGKRKTINRTGETPRVKLWCLKKGKGEGEGEGEGEHKTKLPS
jgi:hypothetical protein